ncbi:MAG: type I-D CRISPR-associated protein Cas10d/Csc3, partial [Candidatus Entotheonellia bacterium]
MLRRRRVTQPDSMALVLEEESLPEDLEIPEPEPQRPTTAAVTLPEEPLFSALLRQAVMKLWHGDPVMTDFVTYVAGPLSVLFGAYGAKGGDFVVHRHEAGLSVTGDYTHDQSLRAHLINGLFPVLHIADRLQAWGAPQLKYLDDRARRLFMAGYVLHDWLKHPHVHEELERAGLTHDTVNANEHRSLVEDIFRRWCAELQMQPFLEPVGGPEAVLHDLIYIACNTQVKWGTMRNISALPRLSLDGRALMLCESLSRLADLISYAARTPLQVSTHEGIRRELVQLSNNEARLMAHHLADNRGILTNLIQNAALDAMQHERRVPILYAPSGVVYLEHRTAPPLPERETVIEGTLQRIREVSRRQLGRSLTGFGRDGKGLKRADFYDLFFDMPEQVLLGTRAALKLIPFTKSSSSGNRYAKMVDGGWLPELAEIDLPDDIRVDQLAEWCYWTEGLVQEFRPECDVTSFVLRQLELEDLRTSFDAIPRDNRAGGVGYHWYFAAGHYLKSHPGRDPTDWEQLIEGVAKALAEHLVATKPTDETASSDAWAELRAYISQSLSIEPTTSEEASDQQLFVAELRRYQQAKRTGQGRSALCTLCSSPFDVRKQQETAILFSPQVYSNKLPLHGSTAIRDICPICSLETMLRQLLMNRSNVSGGRFEGREIRYLYFYPTYFFTPETLEVFRTVHNRLQRIGFTELRRQLVDSDAQGKPVLHLDRHTLQRLEPLLLASDDLSGSDDDRYTRMHFPDGEPITFYFLGIPPGSRDAKNAESWIHPAFLALLLPICLDVKVVASASPLPLLLEADEITETVFLDGAHPFVKAFVRQDRINVDQILPCLRRLTLGYLVHLDANSRQGRGGWDYRWSEIPPLARDLAADPAFACLYLKKWQRNAGAESIPLERAQRYIAYLDTWGEEGETMSHARQLVDLYRQFYRASRYNSNSILRPMAVAAKTILTADPRLFEREGLTEAVRGELAAFMERVRNNRADGRPSPRQMDESPEQAARRREEAMQRFAEYFVGTIFYDTFRGDVAALRGRQLNLLRSACEVLYQDAGARDRQNRQAMEEPE